MIEFPNRDRRDCKKEMAHGKMAPPPPGFASAVRARFPTRIASEIIARLEYFSLYARRRTYLEVRFRCAFDP